MRRRIASDALWAAAVAGTVASALRLRRRVRGLDVLGATTAPVAPEHRFVVADGVALDDATTRAASLHARRHGLAVLDLIPADLPVERIIELVRRVDPGTFRDDPFALPFGAACAVLVTDDVARRAGVDRRGGHDQATMLDLTRDLARCAPHATGHALAPWLRAPITDGGPVFTRAALESCFSIGTPAAMALRGALLLALAAGGTRALRRGPGWGLAALVGHAVQPLLVVAGTAARPRDLRTRAAFRLPAAARDLVGAARAPRPSLRQLGSTPRTRRERRARYQRDFAAGPERLFEPRRDECPLCGSRSLVRRVRTCEHHQRKPGEFTLDECRGCGLVFQNPRLTPAGLDVYYRDFYDGAGEEQMEIAFASIGPTYQARIDLVAAHAEHAEHGEHTGPRRWFDVGAGHGHFCLAAKARWPRAEVHGLDQAASIEAAERRGRVDRAIRGSFPDLVQELAGTYDVVSMHHYLEHTRDPGAELDAAAKVLEPGGLLLVEMPDPESVLARALGRWWTSYLQPLHLNMVPIGLLERLLGERGFTTIARERREAHQGGDLVFAVGAAVNRIAPPVDVPWRPPSTTGQRLGRAAALTAATPVLGAAAAADRVLLLLAGERFPLSNAYRVLARRDA